MLNDPIIGGQPTVEGGTSHDDEATSTKPLYPSSTLPQICLQILINLFVLGLVQLFTWLGLGLNDPFFPYPVTILQVTGCIASLIQIVVFIPSYLLKTEKFYDFTGSATYVTCILYSLCTGIYVKNGQADIRSVLSSVAVLIWCLRLGYFLFLRRHNANTVDERFTKFLPYFWRYAIVWNIQGLWVMLGCLPAFILNSTQNNAPFMATDAIGGVLFIGGLGLEALSDHQKKIFNQTHKGQWIDVGLWRYSRHPNYFFEWTLQLGLFFISVAELGSSQFIAVLSPVFIACLLWFISGVPLLEKRGNAKWGGNPDYIKFRRSVSICVPCFRMNGAKQEQDMNCAQRVLVGEGLF